MPKITCRSKMKCQKPTISLNLAPLLKNWVRNKTVVLNRVSIFFVCLLLSVPAMLFAQAEKDSVEMEQIRGFEAHKDEVEFVTFSKDGKYFASGGSKGTVILWNTASGQVVRRYNGHPSKVNHIAFSNDGNKIAAAFGYGTVIVWDLTTGKKFRETPYLMNDRTSSTAMNFVAFSEDDQSIFFGGETAYLCSTPIDSNNYPTILHDFENKSIEYGAVAPDGKTLIFSVGSDLIHMDMKTGSIKKRKTYSGKKLTSFSFSNDGNKMAAWFMGGEIQILDVATGSVMQTYQGTGGNPWARSHIYFSAGDSLLISGTDRYSFNIWYVESGEKKFENTEHSGPVRAIAFHPDGVQILSGSTDKSIKLWKFKGEEEKEEEEIVEEPKEEVAAVPEKKEKEAEPEQRGPIRQQWRAIEEPVDRPVEPKNPYVFKLPYAINGRPTSKYEPPEKLEFKSTKIEIRVWDDKILDGDIISLYLNDSLILSEYEITKTLKKLNLTVPNGSVCYLTLYAHNLGTIPPNTANVSISDGITEKKIELKSDLYKSASVELKVKY